MCLLNMLVDFNLLHTEIIFDTIILAYYRMKEISRLPYYPFVIAIILLTLDFIIFNQSQGCITMVGVLGQTDKLCGAFSTYFAFPLVISSIFIGKLVDPTFTMLGRNALLVFLVIISAFLYSILLYFLTERKKK